MFWYCYLTFDVPEDELLYGRFPFHPFLEYSHKNYSSALKWPGILGKQDFIQLMSFQLLKMLNEFISK